MRHDMTEAEYIAYLTERSQQPDIQALVDSLPPLEPDQLAVVARIMGSSRQRVALSPSEAA